MFNKFNNSTIQQPNSPVKRVGVAEEHINLSCDHKVITKPINLTDHSTVCSSQWPLDVLSVNTYLLEFLSFWMKLSTEIGAAGE